MYEEFGFALLPCSSKMYLWDWTLITDCAESAVFYCPYATSARNPTDMFSRGARPAFVVRDESTRHAGIAERHSLLQQKAKRCTAQLSVRNPTTPLWHPINGQSGHYCVAVKGN
jgi:hypothetical protein